MTKKEILAEMCDVINDNNDIFGYPYKWMLGKYYDNLNNIKKVVLERQLMEYKEIVEKAKI